MKTLLDFSFTEKKKHYHVSPIYVYRIFTASAPLDQFSHRVAMSVCLSVCLSICHCVCGFALLGPRGAKAVPGEQSSLPLFLRPLFGPQVTWSVPGLSLGPLNNSNCVKTQTQIVTYSKTWIVTKLNNSNCDKTQIVTKLKLWQNSKCDKSQIVTEFENLNCNKTQKLKLWQNLKYGKSQFKKKKKKKNFKNVFLVRTFWHLDNRWDVLWAAFCDSHNVFPPPFPKLVLGTTSLFTWELLKQACSSGCRRRPFLMKLHQ